jgi:hypothetical protein
MVFKSEIFTYIQQDWDDAISRAAGLWAPRVREGASIAITTKPVEISDAQLLHEREREIIEDECERSAQHTTNDGGDCVLVNEHDVLQLWLPGRIIHIFSRRGIYDASAVPRDFADLRRIAVQGNIFRDHSSQSIFEALQEVVDCSLHCQCECTHCTALFLLSAVLVALLTHRTLRAGGVLSQGSVHAARVGALRCRRELQVLRLKLYLALYISRRSPAIPREVT